MAEHEADRAEEKKEAHIRGERAEPAGSHPDEKTFGVARATCGSRARLLTRLPFRISSVPPTYKGGWWMEVRFIGPFAHTGPTNTATMQTDDDASPLPRGHRRGARVLLGRDQLALDRVASAVY